jgi:hypothetical protein
VLHGRKNYTEDLDKYKNSELAFVFYKKCLHKKMTKVFGSF